MVSEGDPGLTLTDTELSGPGEAPFPEPAIGSLVAGRFEIQACIGRGGMGTVFRARDRIAAEIVAIKILRPERDGTAEASERVRRELRLARLVTHPCVVRLHDLVEAADGRLVLSMELVEGESLQARLARDGRLDATTLRRLAGDLAAALAAAHQAGVVHRDIKPANILLRAGSGRAVITDFGVSRAAPAGVVDALAPTALTRTGAIVGTPLYMAPEQFAGGSGPAVDVYALGLVLHEAATGVVPHQAASLMELLRARVADPAPRIGPLRPELPPELRALMERCLEREPSHRPPDGAAVLSALEAAPIALPGAAVSRRWPLALALAAAVGAAGIVAAIAIRPRLPARDRRVSVSARVEGLEAPGIPAALARLTERALRDDAGRYAVGPDRANVALEVVLTPLSSGVTLRARLGPPGQPVLALERSGPSAEAALAELSPVLREALARDQPATATSPDDTSLRRRLGARSPEALRAYSAGIEVVFGQVVQDAARGRAHFEEALRLQPHWGHPLLALALNEGASGVRRGELVAAADPQMDPLAHRALVIWRDGLKTDEALRFADELYRTDADDLLMVFVYVLIQRTHDRLESALAALRRAYERRPDLQFGADVIGALHLAGRDGEVQPFIADWLARAPDNEQALVQRALAMLAQDPGVVEKVARGLLLLRGEGAGRRALLADAWMAAGRWDEASALADRLLADAVAAGDPELQRIGRLRLAEIAILRGRFAAARRTLAPLLEAPDATRLIFTVAHQMLADASLAIGDRADALALHRALRRGANGARTAILDATEEDLTIALLEAPANACPDLEPRLARLPEPRRSVLRERMTRLGASFGCVPCTRVLALGRGVGDQRGILGYGRCALAAGELEQARGAFESLGPRTPSASSYFLGSPAHVVLSRYELGRLHEQAGRPGEARRSFEQFLAHWGEADRPLAEVSAARAALLRLR